MTALKSYEADVLGSNFKTLANGAQFTLSTRLIIYKITLLYCPTDAAPQFL